MNKLFSYGTLRYKKVQIETFGRELQGKKDKLIGYKISMIKINDQDVISKSDESEHPIIEYTGNNKDIVKGVLFNINDEELIKADSYEVKEYERIRVILKSKEKGWVYIKSKP
ncbi:MAG: gamma-glutamylcyclotransferase family protein [Flavobacteriaceae bacterium]